MLNHKPKEAVDGAFVRVRGKSANNSASESGLGHEHNAHSVDTAYSILANRSANMPLPCRKSVRCGGRSSQKTKGGLPPRCVPYVPVAFSFGGVRKGRIAPAVYSVCGLTPCGEPQGSPLPLVRYFLHPHGAALQVGREDGSSNLTKGGRIMADQSSPARCAEALAHHTFKSSDFLKGSDFAANRSLGFILDALSSNDPEGVDAIDSDLRALVNDVADGMNYIASVLEAPADASQKVDSLSPEQSRGLGAIVGLLADTLLLVSAASVQREDARAHLLKNRG